MKQKTIYACEQCEYECQNRYEVFEHEAAHLGLTAPEAQEYFELQEWVNSVSSVCERTNNQDARYVYDRAIKDLLRFEKKHGIRHLK